MNVLHLHQLTPKIHQSSPTATTIIRIARKTARWNHRMLKLYANQTASPSSMLRLRQSPQITFGNCKAATVCQFTTASLVYFTSLTAASAFLDPICPTTTADESLLTPTGV